MYPINEIGQFVRGRGIFIFPSSQSNSIDETGKIVYQLAVPEPPQPEPNKIIVVTVPVTLLRSHITK